MTLTQSLSKLTYKLLPLVPKYFFGERTYSILSRQRDTRAITVALCVSVTLNSLFKRFVNALPNGSGGSKHMPKGQNTSATNKPSPESAGNDSSSNNNYSYKYFTTRSYYSSFTGSTENTSYSTSAQNVDNSEKEDNPL